jgi:hypothetical protein
MKRFLAGILLLSAALYAQPTSIQGDVSTTAIVRFGIHNPPYLTLTSTSADTPSAWVNVAVAKPPFAKGMMAFTLHYRAKATDSSTSNVQFLVESRHCTDPSDTTQVGTGCDSLATKSGYHFVQSTAHMIDTLQLVNASPTYQSDVTTVFYLTGVNQVRFRAHMVSAIAGGKTWTGGGFSLTWE